jgi:aminoglycoside phosphotransferase
MTGRPDASHVHRTPSLLSAALDRFDADRTGPAEPATPPPALDFGPDSLPPPITEITGKANSLEPLGWARSSLAILVGSARGQFVLKVGGNSYRAWQLGYEDRIMRGLAAAGSKLPLAEPLCFTEADGHAFLLQSRLAGRPLGPDQTGEPDQLSEPDQVTSAARLLRDVHAQWPGPFGYTEVLDRQLRLAGRNMRDGLLDPEEFSECGSPASTLRWLRQHKPAAGKVVLLHGDYRPKNILGEGNQARGLVDWGLAMPGDAHYDLAIMLWYIRDKNLRDRFIGEYGQTPDPAALNYYDLLGKFLNV